MTQEHIDYVVNHSDWSEDKKEWTVPSFTYKDKNMGLPKLNSTGMSKKDSLDEKEKKEIVFKNTHKESTERDKNPNDGFRVNLIVKNAREVGESAMVSNHSIKIIGNVNRAQLTPLKADSYERVRSDMVIET